MNVASQYIPHDKDIRLAINEYVCTNTINRCIQLLEKNDEACAELYKTILNGIDITSFQPKRKDEPGYKYGQAVWLYDKEKKTKNMLWLLMSIEDDNKTDPRIAFTDIDMYGQPDFEQYGWKDLNAHIDIFDPAFGLVDMMAVKINQAIAQHENDKKLHPFGMFKSTDEIRNKLLDRTLSNVSKDRSSRFFPKESGHFTSDTVLNGTYRKWDCGLLELDIVFRFGYDKHEGAYDMLSCNNVQFKMSPTKLPAGDGYQQNMDYFYSIDDTKMFMNVEGEDTYESIVGNMKQGNRNSRVNTYFAKIDFGPVKFANVDYMVFSTSSLAQDKHASATTMSLGSNAITWCDKTTDGITAMLVTYPNSNDDISNFGSDAGIAANSFSCHLVGKCAV